ncbi:SDR family oxidoreductase [Polycyclovorans algicola]|uniref:SDR family oxidoreductase n=1 Tax=Polycyclovorans algicola TaxID=616992 RepID=UPI0004A6F25B|nr:NAD(P)-dependent oxidoreductase [Polycyclovorans algicola]
MRSLSGKTLVISGASRGIGLAIALRAARDGANIAVLAKTVEAHPKLPGTIYSAAQEIEAAGGRALPLACDIRDTEQIEAAVAKTVETFGGIDILINNASAISLTGTLATEPKRYDLMHGINARGTFFMSRACIPHLKKAGNPHVLNLSPPLDLNPAFFAPHTAYTLAKYAMSVYAMAMAVEFKRDGIAFNTLWPRTMIATAALQAIPGAGQVIDQSRTPAIMADAAHVMLTRDSRAFTGQHCIDDLVLAADGVTDFSAYRVKAGTAPLVDDLFIPDSMPPPDGIIV